MYGLLRWSNLINTPEPSIMNFVRLLQSPPSLSDTTQNPSHKGLTGGRSGLFFFPCCISWELMAVTKVLGSRTPRITISAPPVAAVPIATSPMP